MLCENTQGCNEGIVHFSNMVPAARIFYSRTFEPRRWRTVLACKYAQTKRNLNIKQEDMCA